VDVAAGSIAITRLSLDHPGAWRQVPVWASTVTCVTQLRIAGPPDAAGISRLRAETELWLAERGVEQWPVGQMPLSVISAQVARGEWHVTLGLPAEPAGPPAEPAGPPVKLAGLPAWAPSGAPAGDGRAIRGALRLLWSDQGVWPADGVAAVYVHGLMTGRRQADVGLGAMMLAWAGQEGRRAGAVMLRLDCVRSNARLRRHYADLGFREMGSSDAYGAAHVRLQRNLDHNGG
jgi:hypothetical protein